MLHRNSLHVNAFLATVHLPTVLAVVVAPVEAVAPARVLFGGVVAPVVPVAPVDKLAAGAYAARIYVGRPTRA